MAGPTLKHPLSASQLKKFDKCPESFRLGYVERLPSEGSENRYIRRGNAVHDAIEQALRDDVALDDANSASFALKRRYWDAGGQAAYDLSDEDDEFVQQCLDRAGKYLASRDLEVVAIESEVTFRLDSLDVEFLGYIDVAGASKIIDWKTGSSEDKGMDETLQGAVYVAGYYAEMGYLPDDVTFVYLKDGTVRSYEPSDELYEEMVSKASALVEAAEDGEFPAQPGDKCYWCDYEVHCAASPVGGGGINWSDYP